jgi:hypothetical protein
MLMLSSPFVLKLLLAALLGAAVAFIPLGFNAALLSGLAGIVMA